MIRILTSVEITKDNPEYLRFKYNDNSYQEYLITTGKPKTCTTYVGNLDNILGVDKGERKICKDDCVYYLIENGQQIRDRRNEKSDKFEYCIFLINTNFHGETFSDATFYGAIFNEVGNFGGVKFNNGVSFNSAKFIKYASFATAKFNDEVSFNLAKFNKNVAFGGTEFNGKVNSVETIFNDRVDFIATRFSKKVDFTSAIFNNVLNFSGVKSIDIDLKHAIIDRIEYGNVEFKSDNRKTFLTLKNVALKQHDQIKALEFHAQEYQSHLKALRENKTTKNLSDKLVLTFESWVSAFGTSTIRSIISLVVIVMLFYFLINGFNYDAKTMVNFASPLSYDIDKIFTFVSDIDRYLFFFYKILQVVFIYEMVKSFRKFSRTL
ncbi:pentapeptide repeat-containing protein [bacterium endosymbiont of Bathymodiolus sp. 5 South]|jgi:hypothetical protein|uniref:pentapeptide repeat-containing protein n=1 Tax=bacterium endosymbiont of Bathymodiolus sp. 5 South TaxID=1181670 RepID=UPI0010B7DE10|nr:pentapeptide repeat-containing protein [bacterium endosymbiont of Bathymodiolus sp. 5 South]CAC9652869.1 hypothetical protein [uncultured Gammaproteobacteria bacterium]SHN92873.1 hypothetical protein BCLUESOX_137 [bacterium endosymbiont of Bathymodiolus sp. 5 South]VVH55064.1 hypothetical protein BSPCLSOX_1611 [uncultured Gammaproteobacteria bacterium]